MYIWEATLNPVILGLAPKRDGAEAVEKTHFSCFNWAAAIFFWFSSDGLLYQGYFTQTLSELELLTRILGTSHCFF